MQVDTARLTRMERARHLAAEFCLYCAAADHLIKVFPIRPPDPEISTLSLLPVKLCRSFCFSVLPRRLGLLGKLYLPSSPKSSKHAP